MEDLRKGVGRLLLFTMLSPPRSPHVVVPWYTRNQLFTEHKPVSQKRMRKDGGGAIFGELLKCVMVHSGFF